MGTTLLELLLACSVLACSVALTLVTLTHVPRVAHRINGDVLMREQLRALLSVNEKTLITNQLYCRQNVDIRVAWRGTSYQEGPEPIVLEVMLDDSAAESTIHVEWAR